MGWGPGGRARGVNTKGGNTSSFLLTLKYTRPVFSFFFFFLSRAQAPTLTLLLLWGTQK